MWEGRLKKKKRKQSFEVKQVISLKSFCPTCSVLAAIFLHPNLVPGQWKPVCCFLDCNKFSLFLVPPCPVIRWFLLPKGFAALEGKSSLLPPRPVLPRERWHPNWEQINRMLTYVLCEREPGLVHSSFPGSREVLALVLLKDAVANRRSKKEVRLRVSLAMWGSGVTWAALAAVKTLQPLGGIIQYGVWSTLYCFKTVSVGKNMYFSSQGNKGKLLVTLS